MDVVNIKFWIILQVGIDIVLVLLIVHFLQHLRSALPKAATKEAVDRIVNLVEPLLKEADATAKTFDLQLKEKHGIVRQLNERLDSRIISLNLLLKRAEAFRGEASEVPPNDLPDIYDQQKAIVDLFNKGHDVQSVARKLALPRREVEMVYNLKRKFSRMEQEVPIPKA